MLTSTYMCVSGQVNVALQKPTNQSSTYRDAVSAKAVDGNTEGKFVEGNTCTHTVISIKRPTEWWCVDLKHRYKINTIRIFNRNETTGPEVVSDEITLVTLLKYRLEGFEIYLSDTGKCDEDGLAAATYCYKDNRTMPPEDIYNVHQCNVNDNPDFNGRYVFIKQQSGFPPILTLCEVQVFVDECEEKGFYGENCTLQCENCDGPCRQLDGSCKTGCKEGYWGSNGLCLETCSYCTDGGCSMLDGVCNVGCRNGLTGIPCKTALERPGFDPVWFGLLIAAVVVLIVLNCINIIIAACVRRRSRNSYTFHHMSHQYGGNTPPNLRGSSNIVQTNTTSLSDNTKPNGFSNGKLVTPNINSMFYNERDYSQLDEESSRGSEPDLEDRTADDREIFPSDEIPHSSTNPGFENESFSTHQ